MHSHQFRERTARQPPGNRIIARPVAVLIFGFFTAVAGTSSGADLEFRGQLSFWLTGHDRPLAEGAAGIRYIPSFSLKKDLGRGRALDAEASFNIFTSLQGPTFAAAAGTSGFKPYRLWARFSTTRFEARLGLQKINFGSAHLLRPLMWFDRIDPNDPLQLTEGVYGLLLKYTFPGDANAWLWGLAVNDEAKGWEIVPTKSRAPEFGGRLQIPVGPGEAAVSYHHRRLDTARSPIVLPAGEPAGVPEDRIGIDGKWDLGVGLWFEAVWTHLGWTVAPWKSQQAVNLGMDFTFGLGNGLHLMAEHLAVDFGADVFGQGARRNLTALTADYPLGILDRLRAVIFRDWTSGDLYRLLTWQRTYDRWSIYAIGFWNPDRYQIYATRREASLFAGRGFRIMIIYNH